jgi:translation elongation factor IF5A
MLKMIDATEVRSGTTIYVDGEGYTARSNDISKTGKHGASKCRIEAVGIFSGKKKIIAVPGHERFDVPLVKKMKGQILSVEGDKVTLMDLESYETIEVKPMDEVKDALAAEVQVEYWDIEGDKRIMRVLT